MNDKVNKEDKGQEENIDLNALAQQDNEHLKEEVEKKGGEEENKFSEKEQKAYDQGWRPKSEFKGDNWKAADDYLSDGKWIDKFKDINKKMDDQKRDFDRRLESANKINEARRIAEIKALKDEQRQAVDLADGDSFDENQKKIDALEQQEPEKQKVLDKDPDITAWENKNPWIHDINDEKTVITQSIFNSYCSQNPNATAKKALEHVDGRLSQLYPDKANPRREQPNSNENKSRKPVKNGKALSMSDLTQDETAEWNSFGKTIFKSENAFLKAISDTRGA